MGHPVYLYLHKELCLKRYFLFCRFAFLNYSLMPLLWNIICSEQLSVTWAPIPSTVFVLSLYLKKTIKNSLFFRTPSFRDWWLDFQLSSISSPMGVVILRKSWPQMVTFQYYGLFCTMTRLWYTQRVHMKLKLKFKYLEKDLVTKEGQSI